MPSTGSCFGVKLLSSTQEMEESKATRLGLTGAPSAVGSACGARVVSSRAWPVLSLVVKLPALSRFQPTDMAFYGPISCSLLSLVPDPGQEEGAVGVCLYFGGLSCPPSFPSVPVWD